MKRIANYRSGDRAESLGVVLMQLFCAVAPVPRQEDFGIVDAVATLLRRDGEFLFAEDSFLLQFKSRTEKVVKFTGNRLRALLDQELALFIAKVDMTKAEISLYSVGVALAHPNINDVKGLVVHLNAMPQELGDNLSTSLGDPVLQWSTDHLADKDFEITAYSVMKKWLELDRWNRRYRKMGLQAGIEWQTNKIPTKGNTIFLWNPQNVDIALTEIVPSLKMIGWLAMSNPELSIPVLSLVSWMRNQGVDPDSNSILCQSLAFNLRRSKALAVWEANPDADIALFLEFVEKETGRYTLRETYGGRPGPFVERIHELAGPDGIRALGLEIDLDPQSQQITAIGPAKEWLELRNCQLIDQVDGVFLLRRLDSIEP